MPPSDLKRRESADSRRSLPGRRPRGEAVSVSARGVSAPGSAHPKTAVPQRDPLVRREAIWKTLTAFGVGALVALPLGLPVLDNMEEGRRLVELGLLSPQDRLRPVGMGPVSGLMLYLFAAPVLITLVTGLWRKLMAIGGAVVMALAVSSIATLFERGDSVLGVAAMAGTALSLAAVAMGLWWQRRRHRATVADLAGRLGRAVMAVAADARTLALSHEEAGPGRAHLGRATVDVVESLALNAIWQAASDGSPQTFRPRALRALRDIRRDLVDNRPLDPEGRGVALMDRILARADALAGRGRPFQVATRQAPLETGGRRPVPVPGAAGHGDAGRPGGGTPPHRKVA